MEERKINKAATDNAETQVFAATPIAKSLSKESVIAVDESQAQSEDGICKSLSTEFNAAGNGGSPSGGG